MERPSDSVGQALLGWFEQGLKLVTMSLLPQEKAGAESFPKRAARDVVLEDAMVLCRGLMLALNYAAADLSGWMLVYRS